MILKKSWRYVGENQHGSQFDYSAQAITILLTMQNVFYLPNRATEGFVGMIFAMLGVLLQVPDPTTLSRYGKDLHVILPKKVD